ncbi:MAG: class I SAM-dependent methyltransferase [Verrucomicrobiota bacterium]|nr:class I SAM-dependent methyltransferase [Verrucomicrobiota bacterium]
MVDTKELWEIEYTKKGIPSSFKEEPSQAVVRFEEYLQKRSLKPGAVLDLGCGKGRNSFYLRKNGFQVTCVDLLEENIQAVKKANLGIDARQHDLAKPFPFADGQFDYAIDIFCFKHLIEESTQKNYLQELKRVLKRGGLYLLTLASVEDGFYGPLLHQSGSPQEHLVVDPFSKIRSILYRREEVEKKFRGLDLIEFSEKRSLGVMHGMQYVRCVLTFIFEAL